MFWTLPFELSERTVFVLPDDLLSDPFAEGVAGLHPGGDEHDANDGENELDDDINNDHFGPFIVSSLYPLFFLRISKKEKAHVMDSPF